VPTGKHRSIANENDQVTVFRRYVAIGDSSTEGLEDPDDQGGYRGWADRLAETIANHQAEPLDYANLGVRSLRLGQIRATQFEPAMAMQPDLLSIFGGANDLLAVTCDFAGIKADLGGWCFSPRGGPGVC
jgi:lysophospholipase L1-like esterase